MLFVEVYGACNTSERCKVANGFEDQMKAPDVVVCRNQAGPERGAECI